MTLARGTDGLEAPLGRFAALKLVGHETNESIMLFEETVPVGTKSLFHLHPRQRRGRSATATTGKSSVQTRSDGVRGAGPNR